MAAIILVVVMVAAGAGSYVAFSAIQPSATSLTTCEPTSFCTGTAPVGVLADVSLFVPLAATQQGATIPFTATLPNGEIASSYTFDFGDGNNTTTSAGYADHVYASAGLYLASVTAVVGGLTHNSYRALVPIAVTTSFTSTGSGSLPGVTGTIVANGTSSVHPTTLLTPGETLSVSGSYTSAPSNPAWSLATPTVVASSGGTITSPSATPAGASATVSFSSNGPHTVAFVGIVTGPGGSTIHQLYVWTTFVEPAGTPLGLSNAGSHTSPHPGTILSYENTPGGTYTSDPAIDYDIVGFEILINIYETLVFYNGTQTGPAANGFVPVIATCVPGSALCQNLYGSSLVDGNNWTFVISSTPQFYDPAGNGGAGAHWGVYPTDVLFSVARTLAFADLPCVGCNNGWILGQSLLPTGNASWDGGLHSTYNNTPADVLNTITLNDSQYCTSAMMTSEHGCVTFHVDGGGLPWPYFLQLIGDTEGGGIVPCGWFSAPAQGAGIPYWTDGNVSGSGDHPCAAPGTSGWGVAPASIPSTGWDNYEIAGSGTTGNYLGNVANTMVGSGPYYMYSYIPGTSYTLRANPAYQANPLCTWSTCYPQPGHYAQNVSVVWEDGPVPGEQALQTGIADYAGIPSSDFGFLLQEIEAGRANVLSIPTINIYFFPFVLNFDPTATAGYSSGGLNVGADWFSYLGMRQFFMHAYPYHTIQSSINTRDGLEVGFPYGGAIPQYLGDYYPKSVNWPSGDPCSDNTNASCPSYWWSQMITPSSPYYDPEAAACSTSSPCRIPLFGVTGDADTEQRLALWVNQISIASGGVVQATIVDVNEATIVQGQYSAPGTNFETAYAIRWVPDYPDPTDYVRPLYLPDTVYTYSGAVAEQLSGGVFNASASCPGTATDFATYAALTNPVSNGCQGSAYWAMNRAFALAAPMPDNATRVSLYAQGEAIANQLALYVYMYQQELVPALGPWIDGSSFNANPVIGAGGDTPWFWISGNSVAYSGST